MLAFPIKEDTKQIFNVDIIVNTLKNVLNNDKGKNVSLNCVNSQRRILNESRLLAGSRELKELVVLTLCNISSIKFDRCADLVLAWKPKDDSIGRETLDQLGVLLKRKALLTQWLHRINPKKYGAHCEQPNHRMTTRNASKSNANRGGGGARFVAGKMKTSGETASLATKKVPPKKKKKKRKRK